MSTLNPHDIPQKKTWRMKFQEERGKALILATEKLNAYITALFEDAVIYDGLRETLQEISRVHGEHEVPFKLVEHILKSITDDNDMQSIIMLKNVCCAKFGRDGVLKAICIKHFAKKSGEENARIGLRVLKRVFEEHRKIADALYTGSGHFLNPGISGVWRNIDKTLKDHAGDDIEDDFALFGKGSKVEYIDGVCKDCFGFSDDDGGMFDMEEVKSYWQVISFLSKIHLRILKMSRIKEVYDMEVYNELCKRVDFWMSESHNVYVDAVHTEFPGMIFRFQQPLKTKQLNQ